MKKDIAASIHQRLLNIARIENRPLNELLQYFAVERFLFRLGRSEYKEMFLLKGAQMLRVWNAPEARPTMDIDLLGKVENNIESMENIIRECCRIDSADGASFDGKSIVGEVIKRNDEYEGIRVTLKGVLGKIRLGVQLDIGFGDVVVPRPKKIELPQLLDLGRPILWGYTPESTIAEKFQAMIVLDMVNTRMKDFYDIWLLLTTLDIDDKNLGIAIRKTFVRRNTELPDDVPTALTVAFTDNETKKRQWQAFLRKNRLDISLNLDEVTDIIRKRLLPLIKTER